MVSHFYPANLWKNLTEILHAATEAYIFWAMGIRTLSTFLLAILLKSQNSWFLETFPTTLWQSSRLFVALLNRRYFHQLKIIRKQQQHTHTHTILQMQRSTSLGVEKPPPKDHSVQSYTGSLDPSILFWWQPEIQLVKTRGLVVEIPIIYKVWAPSNRWLEIGILNHQQFISEKMLVPLGQNGTTLAV